MFEAQVEISDAIKSLPFKVSIEEQQMLARKDQALLKLASMDLAAQIKKGRKLNNPIALLLWLMKNPESIKSKPVVYKTSATRVNKIVTVQHVPFSDEWRCERLKNDLSRAVYMYEVNPNPQSLDYLEWKTERYTSHCVSNILNIKPESNTINEIVQGDTNTQQINKDSSLVKFDTLNPFDFEEVL